MECILSKAPVSQNENIRWARYTAAIIGITIITSQTVGLAPLDGDYPMLLFVTTYHGAAVLHRGAEISISDGGYNPEILRLRFDASGTSLTGSVPEHAQPGIIIKSIIGAFFKNLAVL